jgi:hypothetical protein
LSSQPKKKNNHFVPRSYLQRFCSGSDRQIALYNLKSGRTVEAAPIKSQCSRDYFYTKNPIFEQNFSKIEGEQKRLLSDIIASQSVPAHGSSDRGLLSIGVMFQAGRTAVKEAPRPRPAPALAAAPRKPPQAVPQAPQAAVFNYASPADEYAARIAREVERQNFPQPRLHMLCFRLIGI